MYAAWQPAILITCLCVSVCASVLQVFDAELSRLETLVRQLASAGVDAVIVQVRSSSEWMPLYWLIATMTESTPRAVSWLWFLSQCLISRGRKALDMEQRVGLSYETYANLVMLPHYSSAIPSVITPAHL